MAHPVIIAQRYKKDGNSNPKVVQMGMKTAADGRMASFGYICKVF
jgi:hypothetical protein